MSPVCKLFPIQYWGIMQIRSIVSLYVGHVDPGTVDFLNVYGTAALLLVAVVSSPCCGYNLNFTFWSSFEMLTLNILISLFSVVIHRCPTPGTHRQQISQHLKRRSWPHRRLLLLSSLPNQHRHPNHKPTKMFKEMPTQDRFLVKKKMRIIQTMIGWTRFTPFVA